MVRSGDYRHGAIRDPFIIKLCGLLLLEIITLPFSWQPSHYSAWEMRSNYCSECTKKPHNDATSIPFIF